MVRVSGSALITLSLPLLLLVGSHASRAQVAKKNSPSVGQDTLQRATSLAESGHCAEALPLLKKSIHQVTDRDLKKRIGLDGLHCAMTGNVPFESLEFLQVLGRDFPNDPEILYASTHAYSDLSVRVSEELMREAPFSYQV